MKKQWVKIAQLILLIVFINFCNAQKMSKTEVNQLDEISTALDSITGRMVEDIASIVNGDYGLYEGNSKTDIKFYDFELSADGYSINFYPMDSYNTQLGQKKTLPEYPNGFVRDLNLDIDTDSYDYDNTADMEKLDEFYLQLETKVIDWFNQCFIKAGGLAAKENYLISIHDTYKTFDLKRQKWVNN